MTDGSLIPISDEQAKAAGELVEAGRALGGYVAGILGDLPQDLAGLLIGDRIKMRRIERMAALWKKTQARLHEAGVVEPDSPNLKLALPILMDAADEDSEEMQEIWANLLAATMNPDKRVHVRSDFAEALNKLNPIDAKVLNHFASIGGTFANNQRQQIATDIGVSFDTFMVVMDKLSTVGFAKDYNGITSGLMPFGREFLRAVSDFK
jgi:hypothetical protein